MNNKGAIMQKLGMTKQEMRNKDASWTAFKVLAGCLFVLAVVVWVL